MLNVLTLGAGERHCPGTANAAASTAVDIEGKIIVERLGQSLAKSRWSGEVSREKGRPEKVNTDKDDEKLK